MSGASSTSPSESRADVLWVAPAPRIPPALVSLARPIADLREDADNARAHPDRNLEAIKESLRLYGQQKPIVVARDGTVVAGNGTLAAARALGWTHLACVTTDLDFERARAFAIADNRTAELAEWDVRRLVESLGTLPSEVVASIGFDDDELRRLAHEAEEQIRAMQGEQDLDAVPAPPAEAITKPGDLVVLGRHRLLCGDAGSVEDLDRLLAGAPVHVVVTDPPYNVRVEPRSNNAIAAGLSSFAPSAMHHQGLDLARHPEKAQATDTRLRPRDRPLINDFMDDDEFEKCLRAWFSNMARVMVPGAAAYVWGGYANLGNYPPALKAAGLYYSQALIWDKEWPVLTRKDFMGAHEQCQPAGTSVLTAAGSAAIESLRDGDRVVTFSRHNSMILGRRHGFSVRRTERRYVGDLYGIVVDGETTWTTDGHLWTAKMTPVARARWCVYLMRRGAWWRVGKSKLYTTWGFGPKQRLMKEEGDEAWILSVHRTNVEATTAEQMVSVRYGIPTTFWSVVPASRRSDAEVRRIYDSLDANALHASAFRALLDHHRRIENPLLHRVDSHDKVGARVPFTVRACNLLAEVMTVPMPTLGCEFVWAPIDEVVSDRYDGQVHSLGVEKHEHYVADGIVTHNCFYSWKEGAAHRFYGPPNVPDIWHIRKVTPVDMVHLTEKPVELAIRAITYSSVPGENVLDPFGGSGSTLVAAEKTNRIAFLMEIDPLYCDVIVQRFEQVTGKKAEREGR